MKIGFWRMWLNDRFLSLVPGLFVKCPLTPALSPDGGEGEEQAVSRANDVHHSASFI
jgi:hypothetical protein